MYQIGIEESSGHVYQRTTQIGWYPIWPTPILTQAVLVKPGESVEMFTLTPMNRVPYWFREFSFDPSTRIRRGVFYRLDASSQPKSEQVPHPVSGEAVGYNPLAKVFPRRLFVYYPDVNPVCEPPFKSVEVALGAAGTPHWRVIAVEQISGGEWLHTLKSRSSLGVLPELNVTKIPVAAREKALQVYDNLVDAAYTSGPNSIVDRARDAAQWLIAAWCESQTGEKLFRELDLGDLVKALGQVGDQSTPKNGKEGRLRSAAAKLALRPGAVEVAAAAGEIPARMHARKPHEQEIRNLRPLMDEDAECAAACVALLLREFGWAL